MEDQQRKLENAHRRTVEITGNLPGNNLPSLDEETPEAHNFLTSDPGVPSDVRMDLTSSNGLTVYEATKKQVEDIVSGSKESGSMYVTPKSKTKRKLVMESSEKSKPVYLKEAIGGT